MRHRCAVVGRDFAGMTTSADSLAPSRARRILTFAAGASLFFTILLIAGVIAVGLLLSAPTRAIVGAAPTDLAVESVSIASGSGATLRGWFIPGRAGAGAVVLLHGVHANRLAMLRRARRFPAEGLWVLLFDFPAHGETTRPRPPFASAAGPEARASDPRL